MGNLDGKVAIVTGAGTGIGHGIAVTLAREGAIVVGVGRRLAMVEATAKLITEKGGQCVALSVDVSKALEVTRMTQECVTRFGTIDILVNNSGVHASGGILKVDEDQWDRIMATNLKGVFLCSKSVAPIMLRNRWGRIINIASIGAILPSINAAYCASKGAVVTLTKSMALELSPGGVTVNAICPGTVITESNRDRLADPKVRAERLARSGVGYFGEPSDIAEGVVYLASPLARFVTGAVLVIDGGLPRP